MITPNSWNIEWTSKAFKKLHKLDLKAQKDIQNFINHHLLQSDDPRALGKALTGTLKGTWRYRVGNYRLLAEIQDNRMVIVFVHVNHRKDVYKSH